MLHLKNTSILALAAILASTSSTFAQWKTDTIRGAASAMESALKDPKKVRMLECLGVTVYAAPPANWKAPSKTECDELQRTIEAASADRAAPASDVSPQRGLELKLGALRFTRDFTDQPIALTNSTNTTVSEVRVECGFFRGDELIDTGRDVAEQVLPGQTAYISATSIRSNGITSAKCRIVKWR